MGIPSYFSHIIRNYSNIIRAWKDFTNRPFDILFMDCNSIIYDAVHSLPYSEETKDEFESLVIQQVIRSIHTYILTINPSKTIFIAFDGVAPFAKMEQQRTRRYRTAYIRENMPQNDKLEWDTSAITPGTSFMINLSKRVQYAFENMEQKYNVSNIIVSGADEPGEGEHKLFDYIRKFPNKNDNIALYGLDSDLIMLSLFHLQHCNNIYVFREAPEFLKQYFPIDADSPPDMPYFLDMTVLASSILNEMKCVNHDSQRIYDYVFLCFFLGNDFLPHFPAMNIRTHGIQVILDIYRNFIGNRPNTFIINKRNEIQWKHVNKLVYEISKREHELLTIEYSTRTKHTKNYQRNTKDTMTNEEYLQNIPIMFRGDEQYICPSDVNWEDRHYKVLFGKKMDESQIQNVCINYLEGLEWVFTYYSSGCNHWKWKYNYHYPPLFKDLCKYVPHFDAKFISTNNERSLKPFLPSVQLAYVLPPQSFDNMSSGIRNFLLNNYKNLYADSVSFCWAFCRYFWEAHPILPDISVELLEQWDIQFRMHFDRVSTLKQ
jgi:5'-3' exoribonuclease 1